MTKYIHRRNIRFKNEVANTDKSRLIGVAIDPSSEFHRVIIFNFSGKIIGKPFSIDILRKGYELLIKNIKESQKKISAVETYIAIESAGSYSENFFNHLRNDFKNVIFISPTAVANNRKQKSLYGLKTDDIDCGAIGDLLIRGEFQVTKESMLYYTLKNLVYWREKKQVVMGMLKNQISHRLRRIYPGLNCTYGDNKRLYGKEKNFLYQGVVNQSLTAQQILKIPNDKLSKLFGYNLSTIGNVQIEKLKERLNEMLLPDEKVAMVQLNILKKDTFLLKTIQNELENIEDEIIELGRQTSAKYIMGQIKGITDLYASLYIGTIGNIRNYKSAKHVYSKSGLSPKISQSAGSKSSAGIKRAGNSLLRSILFRMASFVIINEPIFKSYLQKIKIEKKRHWKKNRIAVCRKLNTVLFALMRDKSNFIR
jgi:transposase